MAERFATRFGGVTAYALSLLSNAGIFCLTTIALNQRSSFLYMLTRIMSGFLRHNILTSGLAARELSVVSKDHAMRKVVVFSNIAAMFLGGILGDHGPDIATITTMLALVEFVVAAVVGIISLTSAAKSDSPPAPRNVQAYKNWLLQPPRPYRGLFAPIPSALVVACASMIQCMYPFTDRMVFELGYKMIGLHLAVVFGIQTLVAPAVVGRFGKNNSLLLCACTILLTLGTCINPWITTNGVVFYLIVTLFFTDVPAAVLELGLDAVAEQGLSSLNTPFTKELHRHWKQAAKQWSVTLLFCIDIMFSGREDATRLVTLPVAISLAVFLLTRHLTVTLGTLFVMGWALWGGFFSNF